MEYRKLGNSGLKVSQVCLGTMMFGGPADETQSRAIMSAALDAGINFFDTADKYEAGESERVVGRFIEGRRDDLVIATKVAIPTGDGPNDRGTNRKHIRAAVHASLERLGTDYIDIYYLHTPDATTPIEETLGAMEDLVRAGDVLYVGCSNFWAWQVAQAVGIQSQRGWDRMVVTQPLYNLANRDCEVELLPMAAELGVGVVSYSPLARGVLTGKYSTSKEPPAESRAGRGNVRLMQTEYRDANLSLADSLAPIAEGLGCTRSQLALAWVMANRLVTTPIIGPRTMEQFEDNLGALDVQISPEVEAAIDELVPPGEHCGRGFRDPSFPVTGRVTGS